MDKTKGKTIGLLAMVVVVTIYGVSYISRAVISEYLPTVVILVIQMAVMTILFTGFNLVTGKNMKVKISARHILSFIFIHRMEKYGCIKYLLLRW